MIKETVEQIATIIAIVGLYHFVNWCGDWMPLRPYAIMFLIYATVVTRLLYRALKRSGWFDIW